MLAVPGRGWGCCSYQPSAFCMALASQQLWKKSPARQASPRDQRSGPVAVGFLWVCWVPLLGHRSAGSFFTFCPTWGNCQAPALSRGTAGRDRGEPRRGRLFWLCLHPRKMLVRFSLSLSDLPSPDGLSTPLRRRDPADKPPPQPGCCAQQAAWTNRCLLCQTDDPNPARRRAGQKPSRT